MEIDAACAVHPDFYNETGASVSVQSSCDVYKLDIVHTCRTIRDTGDTKAKTDVNQNSPLLA